MSRAPHLSPPVLRRRAALAAGCALVVAGGAAFAPAAQANFVGIGEDPAGDVAAPVPARDITGAALAYDRRRGALVGAVRLAGEPTRETGGFLTLFAGRRTATGCDGTPAVGFSTDTDEFDDARWLALDGAAGDPPRGAAEKRGGQTDVQRFEVVDPRLAGRRPDCVVAALTERGNPAVVYDMTGPIALKARPLLAIRLRGVPRDLAPGASRRVRVTVSNPGEAATGAVRVRVAGARGLRVSPATVRVRSVPAGGRRTATVRVALSTRARPTTTLRVTAAAGDQRVVAEGRIELRRPSPSGGGGATTRPPQTCTRWSPDFSGESGGSLILVPC